LLIKARMGVSVDGFVATTDGVPSFACSVAFVPGSSHGYLEFIEGCDSVVMGRKTFLPALKAPRWPWGDMQVFVFTSQPLPSAAPAHVVVAPDGPERLVERLRSRGSNGDVHLVGGPRTIQAVHRAGALDRLEVVILPMLLGAGVSLWPPGAPVPALEPLRSPRVFPDGSIEVAYAPS
jgi:dihydrofolate reductase